MHFVAQDINVAEITKNTDSELSLTTYTISGVLNKNDIENIVKDFYAHQPTKLVLWDVTGCSQINISAVELDDISKLILKTKTDRPEGKTAFVINEDNMSLGILFENFSKMGHLPYEYRSFHTLGAALNWLRIE